MKTWATVGALFFWSTGIVCVWYDFAFGALVMGGLGGAFVMLVMLIGADRWIR